MYTINFFVDMYPKMDTPPPKNIKTEEEAKKDLADLRKRNDLYHQKKEDDPCLNCIN